eukprot:3055899-Rhodomonas_salina.2
MNMNKKGTSEHGSRTGHFQLKCIPGWNLRISGGCTTVVLTIFLELETITWSKIISSRGGAKHSALRTARSSCIVLLHNSLPE